MRFDSQGSVAAQIRPLSDFGASVEVGRVRSEEIRFHVVHTGMKNTHLVPKSMGSLFLECLCRLCVSVSANAMVYKKHWDIFFVLV